MFVKKERIAGIMAWTMYMRLEPAEISEKGNVVLNPESYVPYYEQIAEQIRRQIRAKVILPGTEFYSEGELSKLLGISKMPVRQAFQKLRSEGLLIIAQGKRPIIGSERVRWDFQELRGFSEEMRRRGLNPSTRVLSIESQNPTAETAKALQIEAEQQVYYLKRLRFVDQQPVAVVTSFLPVHLFPELEKLDLAGQSLYYIIENIYRRPLQMAEEVIGAVNAGPDEASILQTAVGSALIIIRETTYDTQKIPIEYSISLFRGDRYTTSVISVRKR
ncbi:MAG TPA: GntR family transcriptional regulator [Acidobacteriaceae bacterium]|jgi:GntR family transcriptional regulator|nr:GntR family transcriptional regulator [Acidobacteriaceae bacterium]